MEQINGQARQGAGSPVCHTGCGGEGLRGRGCERQQSGAEDVVKTYARQRAAFKAELAQQVERLGSSPFSFIGVLAMIYRGRINIFAALTIGEQNQERTVMKDVLVGERVALRAYERALRSGLPERLQALVRRQYDAVQSVVEQVRLMRGKDGKQLVVRLYDTDSDLRRAMKALEQAHLPSPSTEKVAVEDETEPYDAGRRSTLFETILAGAVGGALWGAVSGTLAGFGVIHLPSLGLQNAPLAIQGMAWAETALGAIFAGSFVGAVLGTFIGWGIHSGDAYLYNESRQRGQVLLKLQTEEDKAAKAAQIMAEVNREARSHGSHAAA